MGSRWSEKSPGLKILWLWTLGTAAILMTSVVRTRLQDMDKILKLQQQEEEAAAAAAAPPPIDASGIASYKDEILRD